MDSDRAPFVGRENEISQFLMHLELARRGQGGVILVSGEPGMGKTRLVQEAAARVEATGGTVLWGRCWDPGMGAPPFWPWREALVTTMRIMNPSTLQSAVIANPELAHLIPEFGAMAPNLSPQQPEEPDEVRFTMFRAIADFLRWLAFTRTPTTAGAVKGIRRSAMAADDPSMAPLLIVLDDLHWADKASLLLLQYIAHERGPLPFLVVAAYDDSALAPTHPLKAAVAALQREGTVTSIALQGLKTRDVLALVDARVGPQRRTLAQTLTQVLYQATEGNPFFVAETLGHLVQQALAHDQHRRIPPGGPNLGGLTIPTSVRAILERRLAGLSDEVRQALNIAAVIGRDFDAGVLAAAMALAAEPLDAALVEAEVAGVIVSLDHGERFRFRHTMVRKALYDSMPARARLRLHHRIAEVIEARLHGEQRDHVSELAYHFEQVGDIEKTLRYSLLAGEQAERATAWEEAVRQYERCLNLVGSDETSRDTRDADLLVAIGRCSRNANDFRTAWRCFMRAIARFEGAGDGRSVAATTLEALRIAAPPERAAALAHRALTALGDDDPNLEAQLHLYLARWAASEDEAANSHRRAAEIAAKHGLIEVTSVLEYVDGSQALRDGRPDVARHLFERLYEICVQMDRKLEALDFLASANSIPLFAGVLSEGEDRVGRVARFAAECHYRLREAGMLTWLAGTAFARGELDRYTALLDRADELNPTTYSVNALRALRFEVAGDTDRALALAPMPELTGGVLSWQAVVHGVRSRIRFHAGDLAGARDDLDQWEQHRKSFHLADGAPKYLHTLTCVDVVLPALGSEALVEDVYVELCRWAWARFSPANACSIDQLRGALALRLGRLEAAEAHYVEGQLWADREQCRTELGRCLLGQAEVAIRRAHFADARDLLRRASLIFQETGANLFLRQAEARTEEISHLLTRESEREAVLKTTQSADLSVREIEVLRLICDGHTNQQIADHLSISPNTVARHITHIFNKTGASNRTELVSYAHRWHLVPFPRD